MAKKKESENPKKKIGGPFVAAAVFCESILEDMQGMLTVQRILDSITLLVPPNAPDDMPSKDKPVEINPNVLLVFRSGDAPGKHALKLVIEQPSGKRTTAVEKEIDLSSEVQGGVHVKVPATMSVFSSGVFWVDVFLDRKLMTRMPLGITIRRADSLAPTAKKS